MKKLWLLIVFISILLLCIGCGDKPSGEPKEILQQFCQVLEDGNSETAYNLLCSENQSQITRDEFNDWNNITSQLFKPINFKITKEQQLENYSFKGKDYAYAVSYTIAYKDKNYITEKEVTTNIDKIVVSENKEWKVLDEEDYKLKYAAQLDSIGWAYREGKSFDQDINISINYFLKAIEVYPDYSPTYYDIVYAYSSKEQYDKAIQYADIGITKEKDKEILSDLYNIKGTCLEPQNKYADAKISYEKALELNPNNVYASDNLELLKESGY